MSPIFLVTCHQSGKKEILHRLQWGKGQALRVFGKKYLWPIFISIYTFLTEKHPPLWGCTTCTDIYVVHLIFQLFSQARVTLPSATSSAVQEPRVSQNPITNKSVNWKVKGNPNQLWKATINCSKGIYESTARISFHVCQLINWNDSELKTWEIFQPSFFSTAFLKFL